MGIADNTPQKGYCIYAHLNMINKKVYIGISKNVKNRWSAKEESYKKCHAIYRAFKKYGWDNFAHIVMWDNLTKEEACKLEKANIFMFKLAGMSYNITDGGEGTTGVIRSEEHKQIIREYMTNRVVSTETRKKISTAHKKLRINNKEIYAYDINTKCLVKKYLSVTEAALDVGIQATNISRAAKGKRPSAGGYIWGYNKNLDTNNPIYNRIGINTKEVYCYDLYGNYIRKYNSSVEAAKILGCKSRGINACCTKKLPSYKHFIWRKEMCKIEPEVLKRIRFKKHEVNKN